MLEECVKREWSRAGALGEGNVKTLWNLISSTRVELGQCLGSSRRITLGPGTPCSPLIPGVPTGPGGPCVGRKEAVSTCGQNLTKSKGKQMLQCLRDALQTRHTLAGVNAVAGGTARPQHTQKYPNPNSLCG